MFFPQLLIFLPPENKILVREADCCRATSMENGPKERSEVEAKVLDKVGEVISVVKKAEHVNQVICALHSLAILLFPLDASLLSGHSPNLSLLHFTFVHCLSFSNFWACEPVVWFPRKIGRESVGNRIRNQNIEQIWHLVSFCFG